MTLILNFQLWGCQYIDNNMSKNRNYNLQSVK